MLSGKNMPSGTSFVTNLRSYLGKVLSPFWILHFLNYKIEGTEFQAPSPSRTEILVFLSFMLSLNSFGINLLDAISPTVSLWSSQLHFKDSNYAYASLYPLSCWQAALCRADTVLVEVNLCKLILKYLQAYQDKAPALILVISSVSLQLMVLFRVAKQITFKLLAVSSFPINLQSTPSQDLLQNVLELANLNELQQPWVFSGGIMLSGTK